MRFRQHASLADISVCHTIDSSRELSAVLFLLRKTSSSIFYSSLPPQSFHPGQTCLVGAIIDDIPKISKLDKEACKLTYLHYQRILSSDSVQEVVKEQEESNCDNDPGAEMFTTRDILLDISQGSPTSGCLASSGGNEVHSSMDSRQKLPFNLLGLLWNHHPRLCHFPTGNVWSSIQSISTAVPPCARGYS